MQWFTVFIGYTPFMVIMIYWLYSLCCTICPCTLLTYIWQPVPLTPPPHIAPSSFPLPAGNCSLVLCELVLFAIFTSLLYFSGSTCKWCHTGFVFLCLTSFAGSTVPPTSIPVAGRSTLVDRWIVFHPDTHTGRAPAWSPCPHHACRLGVPPRLCAEGQRAGVQPHCRATLEVQVPLWGLRAQRHPQRPWDRVAQAKKPSPPEARAADGSFTSICVWVCLLGLGVPSMRAAR